MSEFQLDFQDTATAFADKSNSDLKEKYRLFRMLNSPLLNALGTRTAKFALSLGLPVEGLIKSTIFEQFCGGETIEECEPTVQKLAAAKIGAILDYSVEGKASEFMLEFTRSANTPIEKANPFSLTLKNLGYKTPSIVWLRR